MALLEWIRFTARIGEAYVFNKDQGLIAQFFHNAERVDEHEKVVTWMRTNGVENLKEK